MKKVFLIIITLSMSQSIVDGTQFKKNIINSKNFFKLSSPKIHTQNPVKSNMSQRKFIKSEEGTFLQGQKIQQFKNILNNKKIHFKQYQTFPSTGYFQEKLKPRYYSIKRSQKDTDKHIEEKIVLDDKDPQLSDKVLEAIETLTLKPIKRKNPKNGFFEADDPKKRDNERNQKEETNWQLFKKLWWTALIVPALDMLWPKKDELASEKPFEPKQAPAYYPVILYKYALDGDLARGMSTNDFAELLKQHRLTVADAVKIQCQIQEEAAYQELTVLANLTDHDWSLLQNILKLRYDFLKGHYNENNVTFDGDFSPEIQKMVRNALQKADVPFKVRVHANPVNENPNVMASAGCGEKRDISFKYHLETGSAGIVGSNIDIELYLSSNFLYPHLAAMQLHSSGQGQKAIIAHEVTHIVNLHSLQRLFTRIYLQEIKKINFGVLFKSEKILNKIYEYQADVLPLADLEHAKAQENYFGFCLNKYQSRGSDIYISDQKGYELSARAVELHKAEAELLIKNRTVDKK